MPGSNTDPTNTAIRAALLQWFKRHSRPMPWRTAGTPYAVWVSEVMLQQTQVAAVVPYYERFLQAFPTVEKLARAPRERVLELWSGLGYYRRARNLHEAAKRIVGQFSGCFPTDYHLARSLPGVGDYTARAVLSIAYNQPYAVLDGNVARVIARLGARRGNLHQTAFRRAVERELDQLFAPRRPGDFNQALMELGQTVCLPRGPQCARCPLRRFCQAFQLGKPEAFPGPRPGRASERHYLASAIIRRGGKLLLVRGLDDGLLRDLWNFPSAFGTSTARAECHLVEKLATLVEGDVRIGEQITELNHGITFRSIRVVVYRTEVSGRPAAPDCRWFALRELPDCAVSNLARKITNHLAQG